MDILWEWRLVGVGGLYGEGGVGRSMAMLVGECAVMLRVFRCVAVERWEVCGRLPTCTCTSWMK